MKNSKDNDVLNQQWFDKRLGEELQEFDAAHQPVVPQISDFEALVTTHKREIVRKQWRDLLLFWLIALPLLSTMLWVLERDWIWFAGFQAAVATGAVLYVSVKFRKRVNSNGTKIS